jgi:SAM-dependent methyltransferase
MNSEMWNPGRLLELSGSYWKTCALHAGVKLDFFTLLDKNTMTAAELAGEAGSDQRGTAMLLDALAAMELLVKDGERYANRPDVEGFLSRKSSRYIGHIIVHHHHLMESWSHLDAVVRTGEPLDRPSVHSEEEWREAFLMGMFDLAMNLAPQLVEQIDLAGRRRLLDLGGGPGTYAIHFCLKNPELEAVVFDLPTTRPFAEQTITRFKMGHRVKFQEGDFLEDPVQGTFDVAWLSHILHGEGPDAARRIIEKAVSALSPGSLIIIHEFILDDDRSGPVSPALFSLNMLLATSSGQSYTQSEIAEMLAAAGVRNIRRLPLDPPGNTGLMMGEV